MFPWRIIAFLFVLFLLGLAGLAGAAWLTKKTAPRVCKDVKGVINKTKDNPGDDDDGLKIGYINGKPFMLFRPDARGEYNIEGKRYSPVKGRRVG